MGVDRLRFETTSHYRFQRYVPLVSLIVDFQLGETISVDSSSTGDTEPNCDSRRRS